MLKFEVTQSENMLVMLETLFEKSNLFGQIAAQRIFLDIHIEINANSPINTSCNLLFLISELVGGIKVILVFTAALVLLSSMMATKTTANPATNPSPTFLIVKAVIIGSPSPGAAINAAITTNESAAITV